MVWPCTWTAATPVGARTTRRLAVVARKYCNRVDLPVPARPVRNTEVRVCSSSRSRAAASACSVSWGLAWRRVRSRCRSDRCGVRRSIACASLSPPATPASHYAAGAALGGSPGFHQRPPGVVACCLPHCVEHPLRLVFGIRLGVDFPILMLRGVSRFPACFLYRNLSRQTRKISPTAGDRSFYRRLVKKNLSKWLFLPQSVEKNRVFPET